MRSFVRWFGVAWLAKGQTKLYLRHVINTVNTRRRTNLLSAFILIVIKFSGYKIYLFILFLLIRTIPRSIIKFVINLFPRCIVDIRNRRNVLQYSLSINAYCKNLFKSLRPYFTCSEAMWRNTAVDDKNCQQVFSVVNRQGQKLTWRKCNKKKASEYNYVYLLELHVKTSLEHDLK